jgi:hypothetical protein
MDACQSNKRNTGNSPSRPVNPGPAGTSQRSDEKRSSDDTARIPFEKTGAGPDFRGISQKSDKSGSLENTSRSVSKEIHPALNLQETTSPQSQKRELSDKTPRSASSGAGSGPGSKETSPKPHERAPANNTPGSTSSRAGLGRGPGETSEPPAELEKPRLHTRPFKIKERLMLESPEPNRVRARLSLSKDLSTPKMCRVLFLLAFFNNEERVRVTTSYFAPVEWEYLTQDSDELCRKIF